MEEDTRKASNAMVAVNGIAALIAACATVYLVSMIWGWNWIVALLAVVPIFLLCIPLCLLMLHPLLRRTPEHRLKREIRQAMEEGRDADAERLADDFRRRYTKGDHTPGVVPATTNEEVVANGAGEPDAMEQIARAPSMVFLTVAGADGEIGQRDLNAFKKSIKGASGKGGGLFGRAVERMLPDIEQHLHHDYGSPIRVIAELAQVRESVGMLFPDECEAFCEALYDLGKNIAGEKPGEGEIAALELVGSALGR